jgi:hypothetical protein
MKQRFYLYRRRAVFYLQDSRTGKQQSLETKDRNTALRLLEIKRQTEADPSYNQFILKSCLATRDPLFPNRTWQTVMEQMQTHGKESLRKRCARAMKSKAYNAIRHVKLVETTAEGFLAILRNAKVSVAHYLKRLHNLALGLACLPCAGPKALAEVSLQIQAGNLPDRASAHFVSCEERRVESLLSVALGDWRFTERRRFTYCRER